MSPASRKSGERAERMTVSVISSATAVRPWRITSTVKGSMFIG